MNYYKRHLGDYAKDTGFLSTYQHGVYALLLDWYYSNERPIPLDLVHRIVRARSGPEKKACDEVIRAFFDVSKEPGFAVCKRADLEISNCKSISEANSLIAKEAWDAKRMRNASISHSERNASHKPLANISKDQKKKHTPADFRPPSWVDQNAWDGYVEMRKRERHPMTYRAMELAVKELERLAEKGNEATAVLNQSTLHGWRGLFELKIDRPNGKMPVGKTASAINKLQEMLNGQQNRDIETPATASMLELGGPARR